MSTKVKIGDYIEGCELVGAGLCRHVHKTRLIVDSISEYQGVKRYSGKVDDSWHGARGGVVADDLGEIKIITEENPFQSKWWENLDTLEVDRLHRNWNIGNVVRKADGTVYTIIGFGVNSENKDKVVIYRDINNTSVWYTESIESFEKINEEFEDGQIWKFEIIGNEWQ